MRTRAVRRALGLELRPAGQAAWAASCSCLLLGSFAGRQSHQPAGEGQGAEAGDAGHAGDDVPVAVAGSSVIAGHGGHVPRRGDKRESSRRQMNIKQFLDQPLMQRQPRHSACSRTLQDMSLSPKSLIFLAVVLDGRGARRGRPPTGSQCQAEAPEPPPRKSLISARRRSRRRTAHGRRAGFAPCRKPARLGAQCVTEEVRTVTVPERSITVAAGPRPAAAARPTPARGPVAPLATTTTTTTTVATTTVTRPRPPRGDSDRGHHHGGDDDDDDDDDDHHGGDDDEGDHGGDDDDDDDRRRD